MAKNDYTEPTQEQMKAVLEEIALMARSIEHLCISGIDGGFNELSFVAAQKMATQIGWMADRCLGFTCVGSDGWLLPSNWENETSGVRHE